MGEFKIEKGLALPPRKGSRYPFREMEVARQLLCALSRSSEKISTQNRLSGASARPKERGLGKFSVRQVEGGLRVWRTE